MKNNFQYQMLEKWGLQLQ